MSSAYLILRKKICIYIHIKRIKLRYKMLERNETQVKRETIDNQFCLLSEHFHITDKLENNF